MTRQLVLDVSVSDGEVVVRGESNKVYPHPKGTGEDVVSAVLDFLVKTSNAGVPPAFEEDVSEQVLALAARHGLTTVLTAPNTLSLRTAEGEHVTWAKFRVSGVCAETYLLRLRLAVETALRWTKDTPTG